jgi:phosphoribosylamine--glycine ligase
MRCGWPAMNLELALFDVDFVEFLAGVALGQVPRRPHRLDEVCIGVVMAHGDFPHSRMTRKETVGVPIWDVTEHDDDLHFAQVMQDGDHLATAGDYVLIATGTGDTVQEARRRAYAAIERPHMPSEPFWRPDIGQRLRRDLEALQRHGYARGISYA